MTNGRYKLIRYTHLPHEELYDLRHDPYELDNLLAHDDASYAAMTPAGRRAVAADVHDDPRHALAVRFEDVALPPLAAGDRSAAAHLDAQPGVVPLVVEQLPVDSMLEPARVRALPADAVQGGLPDRHQGSPPAARAAAGASTSNECGTRSGPESPGQGRPVPKKSPPATVSSAASLTESSRSRPLLISTPRR